MNKGKFLHPGCPSHGDSPVGKSAQALPRRTPHRSHSNHMTTTQRALDWPATEVPTGIPWVPDFRDPWSDMDYLDDFYLNRRARKKQARLEKLVADETDRIVVTSPRAATQLTGKSASKNEAPHNKARWIPNGWDRADFKDATTFRKDVDTMSAESQPFV